jgi:DNA-3-methyladenine glycosylase I
VSEAEESSARDDGRTRCHWATGPWLIPYHDYEWGVPVHDDDRHLELLVLEGAQAGLSWLTVLRRRDGYRRAFADFEPAQVAGFNRRQIEELVADPRIIRHRQKVESAVTNAVALIRIQAEVGSFDEYIWSFVGGSPVINHWRSPKEVPANTALSACLSADLRRRGFHFVGPTVCYSYLQAAGLVLDHLVSCFRFAELGGGSAKRRR